MAAVEQETRRACDLLDRIETLERVARTLPEHDEGRSQLLGLVEKDLDSAPPLRPRIAAQLLTLSEKTVQAWTREGVLQRAEGPSSRTLLDVRRVHQVLHLVQDLRAAGRTTGLLDEVHRRLVDATWLEREDLGESLAQLRRREGTLRVAKQSA